MSDDRRIYGPKGSEQLAESLAAAYESFVEPYYEPEDVRAWPVEIEEWTVADNRHFFPSADTVIEDVLEGRLVDAEGTNEYWWDDAGNRALDEEVREAFSKALNLWASKIDYYMADEHVASYWIDLVAGEPVFSDDPSKQWGVWKPLYTRTQSDERRAKALITRSGVLAAAHGYTVGDELSEAFAEGWVRNLLSPSDEMVDLSTETVKSYLGRDASMLRRSTPPDPRQPENRDGQEARS